MLLLFLAAQAASPESTTPVPSPASETVLDLNCPGEGEHRVVSTSALFFVTTANERFDDEMDVHIAAGAGKARVPRRLIPDLHGGENGWFEMSDLVITDDVITAEVKITFAHHPKIRIDRRSGSVSLHGKIGDFTGKCAKVDPTARAF